MKKQKREVCVTVTHTSKVYITTGSDDDRCKDAFVKAFEPDVDMARVYKATRALRGRFEGAIAEYSVSVSEAGLEESE